MRLWRTVRLWLPGRVLERHQRSVELVAVLGESLRLPPYGQLWVCPSALPLPLVGGLDRPKPRRFVSGVCPACGVANTVERRRWHNSIRCIECTKARWRETHYARAKRYGVRFDVINPNDIFERDDWKCGICGRKTRGVFPAATSPTLDHIIPMSRGGAHVRENLRCACLRCNSRKGNRTANDQLLLIG